MFLFAPPQNEIKSPVKKNLPTRLIIKNLNIDLEIFPAKVTGQNWDTTSLGVSWLDISPVPGEKGNSIIYGHNWTNLLGSLFKAKPGDTIEIAYQNAPNKIFTIEKTAMVSPDNVSVLNQTENVSLTIYTCAGLFDEKRFVVVGKLKLDSRLRGNDNTTISTKL